ncbi:hypothetical protein JHK82_030497 [Glycine max]|nr:hypothetical protein JHK85_031133 [Glycine max]KAG4993765.1 hypothetical protein JHK86_030592 [Glycine max]KAG5123760.1 hypothetical protein JHK82_030497 [Glycine max]KAG5145176.1 hypothetical protein JHK84_030719 [Glycine max]
MLWFVELGIQSAIFETYRLAIVSTDGNAKEKPAKSSNEAKNKAAAEPDITITRLDIRVGLIKKAQKLLDADELYVEEIDIGEEQTRNVVSGLVKFIPLDEMQNRKVCVLCNLKPATRKGIKFELVEPPSSAQPGERITFPGYEGS